MEEKLIDNNNIPDQNQPSGYGSNLKDRMKSMSNSDKLKNMVNKEKLKENFAKLKGGNSNDQIRYKVSRYNKISPLRIFGLVVAILCVMTELFYAIRLSSIVL